MRGLWQACGAQRRNLGLRNEALPVQRGHAQRDALLRGGDGGGRKTLHGLQIGLLRRARPGGPRTRVPDAPVDMRRHGGAGAVADIDLIAQRAGIPHAQQAGARQRIVLAAGGALVGVLVVHAGVGQRIQVRAGFVQRPGDGLAFQQPDRRANGLEVLVDAVKGGAMRVAAVIVRRLADVDGVEFLHEVSWNSPARRRKSWLTPDEKKPARRAGSRARCRDCRPPGRVWGIAA